MAIIRARDEQPTVQLRFRVPAELAARLERIREEVEAQGHELPLNELVTRALGRVALKAEQDLMVLRVRGGRGPAAAPAEHPLAIPGDAEPA